MIKLYGKEVTTNLKKMSKVLVFTRQERERIIAEVILVDIGEVVCL